MNTALKAEKDSDTLIFDRNVENGTQTINFYNEYEADEKNKLFIEVLAEKLLQKDELLISFLNSKYKGEFPDIDNSHNWFDSTLVIIKPDAKFCWMNSNFGHKTEQKSDKWLSQPWTLEFLKSMFRRKRIEDFLKI